jgi:ABC-type transport system involved in multi-copper enzyme maturation permease subunit
MSLFGPLFPFELVRMTRGPRPFLLRAAFGLLLFFALAAAFRLWGMRSDGAVSASQLALFADRISSMFMAAQAAIILLLTPVVVGNAIREEKDRRTLDALLTTPLADYELILGKLVARLSHLGLLLLAGLPVLSLLELLGGLNPLRLLFGYGLTMAMMWALAGVSLWFTFQFGRDISFWMIVLTPFNFELVLTGIVIGFACIAALPVEDWVTWSALGLWHVGLGIVFTYLSARHVRRPPEAKKPAGLGDAEATRTAESDEKQNGASKPAGRPMRARPPIWERPVLWKERYVDHHPDPAGCALAVLVWTFAIFLISREKQELNIVVRLMGASFACGIPLALGIQTAATVSGEREKRTLESLLATPLSLTEVLRDKWRGRLRRIGWGDALGLFPWIRGVLIGDMHPMALPFLVVALVVHIGFTLMLGLFVSVSTTTKRTAQVWTFAVWIFVVIGGPWWCIMGIMWLFADFPPNLTVSLGLALTPFAFFFGWPFFLDDHGAPAADWPMMPMVSMVEVLVVAAAAWVLRCAAVARFRRTCGRIDDLTRSRNVNKEA